MPKKIATFLSAFLLIVAVYAQPQRSNIYLFSLQVSDTSMKVSKPRFLTHFNDNGYNNQPAFFSNNELYISAQTAYDNQTDLYMLDLEKKTKGKVTSTAESEFSPQRMPDFYNFSAIRQEINGRDTLLRLWQFPIDRLTNGKPVFKYLQGIGYYHWLNGYQVAVFMVDRTNYLGIADTRTDKVEPIATNPGRCFVKLPNGNLAYVQKSDFMNWRIMEKNLYRSNMEAVAVIQTRPGSEDFAVLPDGTFLMGQGSKLYKFNKFKDKDWVEIADLRFYNINNITRLAVSNDYKLALVTD